MPEQSNVQPLLRAEAPVNKVIATAVNIVVGLADDRQITFSTGYEGDESDEAVNARLDRTMGFANRLKAVYSIPKLEEELHDHEVALQRFMEDFAAVNDRYERGQASRAVEIAARRRDAEHAWATSGKTGDFKPQGATKRDLDLIQGEIDRAERERDQYMETHTKTLERYQDELAARQSKLAKAKALAEG